ncbi:hypothetical protein C6P88_09340 [Burkholderia contaminans]|nr:hypothetical protein C6P88_09340 [Burkholderia contaminans]
MANKLQNRQQDVQRMPSNHQRLELVLDEILLKVGFPIPVKLKCASRRQVLRGVEIVVYCNLQQIEAAGEN